MLTMALALVVILPALGAVAVGLMPPRPARWMAVVLSLAVASLAVGAALLAYPDAHRVALASLPWLTGGSGEGVFGLLLDPLSTVLLLVVTVIGFLTVLYSTQYLSEKNRDHPVGPADQSRYYFWLLAVLASMLQDSED